MPTFQLSDYCLQLITLGFLKNIVTDFEMNESADVAPNLFKNRKPRTKRTVNYV